MSKAEAGMKLVRWLPRIAEAAADDIARFGPQAARVRALLDYLPTRSKEARRVADTAHSTFSAIEPRKRAYYAAKETGRSVNVNEDLLTKPGGIVVPPYMDSAARSATFAEPVADLIPRDVYLALTNPLAAGRAFDVLRPRAPGNFLDVVRGLGERGLVQQPVDVLGARTLARAPKSEREALMEVINAIAGDTGYADTGYDSLAELIEAARLLG